MSQTGRLSEIPIKNPTGFLVESEKLILKLIWKCKEPRKGKTNLKKKSIPQEFTLPEFKTYKGTVIKTGWNGHID